MASGLTNRGLLMMLENDLDLESDTVKIMLVDDTFAFDPDVYVVDKNDDSVNDAHHHEISVSGYTGGFNGAGRKTATVAINQDDTNDRVNIVLTDLTWTTLAAGATIGMALLIQEVTNDQDSIIIAAFDLSPDIATNGGDFDLDFSTGGDIQIG